MLSRKASDHYQSGELSIVLSVYFKAYDLTSSIQIRHHLREHLMHWDDLDSQGQNQVVNGHILRGYGCR